MAKTHKRSGHKRSGHKRKRNYTRTKKQTGGFRYGNLHSGDILVSASAEPKSRSRSRTRSKTRSKSKKNYKKWF